jgi:hypothetical protein
MPSQGTISSGEASNSIQRFQIPQIHSENQNKNRSKILLKNLSVGPNTSNHSYTPEMVQLQVLATELQQKEKQKISPAFSRSCISCCSISPEIGGSNPPDPLFKVQEGKSLLPGKNKIPGEISRDIGIIKPKSSSKEISEKNLSSS